MKRRRERYVGPGPHSELLYGRWSYRWTYRILAINAMGVWAEETSCTVRELDPSEVI